MSSVTVNEGSTAYLTVSFKDQSGNALVPASATWQVHDMRSGQVMQAETAVPGLAAETIITIPPAVNAIVKTASPKEVRRVTIKAAYGPGQAINAEYDYTVVNLTYVGA